MQHMISAAELGRAQAQREREAPWSYRGLLGSAVELSGQGASAPLAVAMELVFEAQRDHELTAWICAGTAPFFPPDAESAGVDLSALAVIEVGDGAEAGRIADKLLRSGGVGLIVVDLGEQARVPAPLLGRLSRLAQTQQALVLLVTDKERRATSLGAMISLRVWSSRHATPDQGIFRHHVHALKDKRRAPGWQKGGVFYGPSGLR